jgi:phage tail protein X
MVGVNGQRAIEEAVANAIAHGIIADGDTLPSSMTLTIPRINLTVKFDGEIALQ